MTPVCRVCGKPCGKHVEPMYFLPGGRAVGLCSTKCQRAYEADQEPREIPRPAKRPPA